MTHNAPIPTPGLPRCKQIIWNATEHWWPANAKIGDRCLCGRKEKGRV